jgi:uncharacterized protein YbjT (DUF2867 family)
MIKPEIREILSGIQGGRQMILVVGATGFTGSEICKRLAARGHSVRALVRATAGPERVSQLQKLGVGIVQGDVRDRHSLSAACRGATAVISTMSSIPTAYVPGQNDLRTADHQGLLNLIDAAKGAGLRQFVYTSISGGLDLDFPMHDARRAVETHLRESGLVYTILRPTFFMEAWLSPAAGFDFANATATIYGEGTRPISWISLADVAEFAVQSLAVPAACDAVLELGGPEALSPLQVVQIFEARCGRPFAVRHVPEDALGAQQAAATDPMAQSFTALMRCYARGDAINMQAVLAQFPIRLTSVQDYATAVMARC